MGESMYFEGQTFLNPRLEVGIVVSNSDGHDADRRATINLLEPLQNGPDVSFVPFRFLHVVDGQNDGGIDVRFANPLRRGEPGKVRSGIKRIGIVQVNEPIAVSEIGVAALRKERTRDEQRDRG